MLRRTGSVEEWVDILDRMPRDFPPWIGAGRVEAVERRTSTKILKWEFTWYP